MRKRLRKLWSVALTAALTLSAIVVPGTPMETTAKADTTFDNLNQSQITEAMGAGWNLGNQLEAVDDGIPWETNWGNPVIQEELILAVKDAGFKSIRIPVSYLSMIGSAPNYTIQSSWLDRVQEVVDMCVENDMYAILNMHGDGYYSVSGGWLLCGESDQTTIKAKYEACWEQIATRFKDYDEHLIFESMNEVFDGTYGTPNATAYDNINAYNQIFVDTVRQTGGNNDKRWLLIPGWNTNIDYTAGDYGFELPTDNYLSSSISSGEKRIMISVHYYSPWEFCGQEDGEVTQWGDTVTDDSKKASWGDESYLDSQFTLMNNKFVDAGYPVIIGEYGSIDKSDLDVNSTANRAEFARKVCHYADIYGCVPVYWDNGFNRKFGFGLFDRSTYQVTQQTIIDAIMETYGENTSVTATGISLDKTSMTIQVGDEKQTITATLTPSDSTEKITWTTSDEKVATVNSKGQVTAVGAGNCTITASVPLGASASCTVTVPEASTIRAKLHLLETSGFQSIVSDEFAEIGVDGGNYTLSIIVNDTQLQSMCALYIRDILSEEYEASVFDYAKIKITSVEVNGKSYSMINDTFTYDTSLDGDSADGLSRNYFDFSLINIWANTQVNDVTVDSGNIKASFNNVSYTICNTIEVSFQVSEVAGGETPAATTSPIPTTSPVPTESSGEVPEETLKPTLSPTQKPTQEPTEAPIQKPTEVPTVTPTQVPEEMPTIVPTVAPSEDELDSEEEMDESESDIVIGTKVVDEESDAVYRVVESEESDFAVEFVKPNDSTKKYIEIPSSIFIDDMEYDVIGIADKAFYENKAVSKIYIDADITYIGDKAFYGCKKIKSINIASTVESIGKYAFYKCTKLKKITIKTTELSSETIGKNAFKGIHKKAKIKVPKKCLKKYKRLLKKKGISKSVRIIK